MILELNAKLLEYHEKFDLFGIILFTEAHPYVIKTLDDKDCYAALNEITGNQIAVLSTMLFQGRHSSPNPPPKSTLELIVPVWKEPNENKKILKWFNISDSRDLPLFVLLGFYDNNLYYQKYPIKCDSIENVFFSLQKVLTILSTNREGNVKIDKKKLFKQQQWKIKKLHAKQKIKKFFEAISLFRSGIGY